jgi:hypothetical protein
MKYRLAALAALAALSLLATRGLGADEPDVPEGVEVLARGPVHEAFAEAGDPNPTAANVVPKEPPAPIEEVPPEEKPEGDNISWVPGYWAWDSEASNYMWVSGFWRAVPPGKTWVPGSWQKSGDGYGRVTGYWADEKGGAGGGGVEEEELVPEPPATLDRGPSTPAPTADSDYVPGMWVYQTDRFAWRPGFWLRHRPGWVWCPGTYKWTPLGYIYVRGYWDVPLLARGLLYAPVRFSPRVLVRRGFFYRPSFLIQPDFLLGSLFVRKGTRRYYFGDFYDVKLRTRYIPWVDYRYGRGLYDPNYTYYRRFYAGRPAWEKNLVALYAGRRSGTIARPPHTLVAQTTLIKNYTTRKTGGAVVSKTVNITNIQNVTAISRARGTTAVRVSGLSQLAGGRPVATDVRTVRVTKLSADHLREEKRHLERHQAIARERHAAEVKALAKRPVGTPPPKTAVRVKVELPKTVPPPRKLKHPTPPPPPPRPKVETKPPPKKDKGK